MPADVPPAALHGDPRLPPELMLEIASFLLEPPYAYAPQLELRKAQIQMCLRLSHSCRIFREVFTPHLWATLDAFFADDVRLDVQMREIQQAAHLVKHVKFASEPYLLGIILNCSFQVNLHFLAWTGAQQPRSRSGVRRLPLRISESRGAQDCISRRGPPVQHLQLVRVPLQHVPPTQIPVGQAPCAAGRPRAAALVFSASAKFVLR